MKSTFKLNKRHELILQILFNVSRSWVFTIDDLLNAMKLLEAPNLYTFNSLLRIISKKEMGFIEFKISPERLTEIENDLLGLRFVDLVWFNGDVSNWGTIIKLTDRGIGIAKRIDEGRRVIMSPSPSQRSTIFIASAFGHDDTDQLYKDCFEPACENFNYQAVRVDMNEPSETITSSIMEGIVDAACVIADLTYARPSVYFEIGYAHGLGVPLLLTCRKDHLLGKHDDARVHFDLAQFKISFWTRNAKGKFTWEKAMSPADRLSHIVKPFTGIEK